MTTLATYLWKEWREQRATLVALAATTIVAMLAVAALLPHWLVRDEIVFEWTVGLVLLATVLSIGADSLARERQGTALVFLQRVPAGLASAFRAKLAFFVLALIAAAAFGVALGAGTSWLVTGTLPQAFGGRASTWLAVGAVAFSLWIFAVSSWVQNSALALPATLLFLAAFGWPAVLAVGGEPRLHYGSLEAITFIALCVIGAPVSAYASFVVGSRSGRTRLSALLLGLASAVPFFAPSWVWAIARLTERPALSIGHAWVGPDARFAFLDLSRERAEPTALVLDLTNGATRFAGTVGESAFGEDTSDARQVLRSGPAGIRCLKVYDGAKAAWIDTTTATSASSSDCIRCASTLADFGVAAAPRHYLLHWAGLGRALFFVDGEGRRCELYRDLASSTVIARGELPTQTSRTRATDVRIRDGRWLVQDGDHWMWFEPSTREHGVVECLKPRDRLGASLDDGRFLVFGMDDGPCTLDVDTGVRRRIEVHGLDRDDLRGAARGQGWDAPVSVREPSILLGFSSHGWRGPLLFDPNALSMCCADVGTAERIELLQADQTTAITLEDLRELVRYDFERGSREVLFDVASLR